MNRSAGSPRRKRPTLHGRRSNARAADLPPPEYSAAGPLRQGNTVTDTADDSNDRDRVERAADVTPAANATLSDALFPDFPFSTVRRVLFEE